MLRHFGEEVDRMPSFWMGIEPAGKFNKEFVQYKKRHPFQFWQESRKNLLLGHIMARNWLSRDTTSLIPFIAFLPRFPKVYYNPETDNFYTNQEAKSLKKKDKNSQITLWGEVRQFGYKLGKEGERLHKYWWYHKPFFSGSDALQKFEDFYTEFGAPWERDPAQPPKIMKLVKYLRRNTEKKNFPQSTAGHIPMHFEGIWGGFGPTTIAKLSRKNPGKLHEICQKFEKVCLMQEQDYIDAGFKIFYSSDDLGQKNRSLISPKIYEEFFAPALKARCKLAHKHDGLIFMHSCGYIEEMLDILLDAGLDGLQSLEVPAGNNLARIRAKVRDHMCLIGGLDSTRIMTYGTPDEVETHIKTQIKDATTLDGETMNGGYIPGPSHDLLDTPLANVERAIHSISKYGRYPLNW